MSCNVAVIVSRRTLVIRFHLGFLPPLTGASPGLTKWGGPYGVRCGEGAMQVTTFAMPLPIKNSC